ncbi:MAG: SigE family RNA polymerase sigma factor [Acidimicrobiia bacterium]
MGEPLVVREPIDAAPDSTGLSVVQAHSTPLSYEDCYREQFRPMVRLAFLLTGSAETAQDVVQDAFVRLHRRWSSVEQPAAYVRRSVVNGCHSHHRRVRLERTRRPDPGAAAVDLDADEITDALAALPHRQRAALVLRFYLDLPDTEAAAVLGCRVGTVGSLVHRGLAQLRKDIER